MLNFLSNSFHFLKSLDLFMVVAAQIFLVKFTGQFSLIISYFFLFFFFLHLNYMLFWNVVTFFLSLVLKPIKILFIVQILTVSQVCY